MNLRRSSPGDSTVADYNINNGKAEKDAAKRAKQDAAKKAEAEKNAAKKAQKAAAKKAKAQEAAAWKAQREADDATTKQEAEHRQKSLDMLTGNLTAIQKAMKEAGDAGNYIGAAELMSEAQKVKRAIEDPDPNDGKDGGKGQRDLPSSCRGGQKSSGMPFSKCKNLKKKECHQAVNAARGKGAVHESRLVAQIKGTCTLHG